jgi:mevalonate kinase
MLYEASAPGSVMLLGEHAVLHGYSAVVCAVNRRISVKLKPRDDDKIHIFSEALGECVTDIKTLSLINKKFQFVLVAINQFKEQLACGFDLHIVSEFSAKVGLGSSAAVTVATLAVLQKWLDNKLNLNKLYEEGLVVVRNVQQRLGSGADVAASVFGGVLHYQIKPAKIIKLNYFPKISLVYTGYKTPTVEVIKKVQEGQAKDPEYFAGLFKLMGECTELGVKCIKRKDLIVLGDVFALHQEAQEKLGVSDKVINEIIVKANKLPGLNGAKISGAGLGDCIVVLGELPKNYFPEDAKQKGGIRQIEVEIEKDGVELS